MERARPYFEEHAKVMAPLGMLRYSEEHARAVAARQPQSPTSATMENGVRNRSWLCGPPADIVVYLKDVERRYPGLDHVMIGLAIGTPREMMIEQLTRFAREVMPAFPDPLALTHPRHRFMNGWRFRRKLRASVRGHDGQVDQICVRPSSA